MRNWAWPLVLACGMQPIMVETAIAQGRLHLGRTASLHWEQVPLREALERLSHVIGESIFTDRRVDPRQRISLDVRDGAVDEVLQQMAAAASLGASRLGGLTYIGPPAAASQLRTLAAFREEEIAKLPTDLRMPLQRKQKIAWPRLSEPRLLVTQLVEDVGWRVRGTERIPHDLWAAGNLSELSFAEQLTLLLVGFDLTFAVRPEGREIEIVPITGSVTLSRRYRLPDGVSVEVLKRQFPEAAIRAHGEDVLVDGMQEVHERIAELLGGNRALARDRAPPRKTRKLYTLRVEQQPVGTVLDELGRRLGWKIEIDEAAILAAGASLEQRVSFSVQGVDEDELLRAVLGPAGLVFEREGEGIRVFATRR